MSPLFSPTTTAIIYGRKSVSIQRMLDFDFLAGRTPSIAAVVDTASGAPEKAFFGTREFLLPVVRTLAEAHERFPQADVLVSFASLRSAGAVVNEAIERKYRVVATIAEGVPERDTRAWIVKAKKTGTMLIGPATVGAVTAGAFRIGDTGGSTEHLLASKLHRPGCVGYVGKSGGMSNEMYRMIAENSSGIAEGVAIGGDRNPGSHLMDHLLRYQEDPQIAFLVLTSEIGGREEEDIAQALKNGTITKPLIAWVAGTSAACFPKDVQFGHAGAWAASSAETAIAKNQLLRDAGARVPESFEGLPEIIAKTYQELKKVGTVAEPMEPIVQDLPENRRHTHLQCTISNDTGEEALYGSTPISQFIQEGSLPKAIAQLWWKTELSEETLAYLAMILTAIADHGPAVAGAHNAIVAASAARDTVSALCSGLLTIGPRFGGAVDSAAQTFHDAQTRGLTPQQFVEEMKTKGERIPGIGHKIKSVHNPDSRVQTLLAYVTKNFTDIPLTRYALEVERITTGKKPNLILNVDGLIGVSLVDILLPQLPEDIRASFFDVGYLNGLFALGRSIGILGHIFDQKRLNTPLYRHPQEDILYGEGTLNT
ncbi:MAG: citrate/2-methylcitrate synthase [Candidatus Peribacteraceae bacterium]